MCNFSNKVKNKLFRIIADMDKISWLFAKNPKCDFTRKSPLSLKIMLKLMVSMEGQTIHQELYKFFDFKVSTPTTSAFVQRRNKIDISAFEYLFHKFNAAFKSTRMVIDLTLTRRQTKTTKANPDKYRTIMTNMIFDYLHKRSKSIYPMRFRIVRIKLSVNSIETLVTNLPRDLFPSCELKMLYNMRWGIETSFRELKYNVGLTNFHSKKADLILQEVYARLIMYNLTMIITRNICINHDNRVHKYQINYAEAIFICRHFIGNRGSPPNAEALILKNILPVRPDHKYSRKLKPRSAVSFIYRVA